MKFLLLSTALLASGFAYGERKEVPFSDAEGNSFYLVGWVHEVVGSGETEMNVSGIRRDGEKKAAALTGMNLYSVKQFLVMMCQEMGRERVTRMMPYFAEPNMQMMGVTIDQESQDISVQALKASEHPLYEERGGAVMVPLFACGE